MTIDPVLLVRYALPIVALTVTVIVGKIASVTLGAFFTGNGVRTSLQAAVAGADRRVLVHHRRGSGCRCARPGEFSIPSRSR